MRTKIEAARLRGFDQNSVNHPGILLMAHSAQFFTLDEVNPFCRPATDNADGRAAPGYLLSRYRESGPAGMANRRRGNPSNNQLPDGFAQYALNIIRDRYTDFGRCWRVKSLQNCTMSTCRKKLSGRLWLKPVSGSPSNNVRRKFSSHVIVLPVVVS